MTKHNHNSNAGIRQRFQNLFFVNLYSLVSNEKGRSVGNIKFSFKEKSFTKLFVIMLIVSFNINYLKTFAQVAGDYGSNASGTWSTPGTWVVCVTDGTWTGATAAGAAPTAAKNVWIRSGHTVNIASTGAVGATVTVQNGGILTSTGNNLTATSFVLEGGAYYSQAGSSAVLPGTTKNFALTSTVEFNGSQSSLSTYTYGGNLILNTSSTVGIGSGNSLNVSGNLTSKRVLRGNSSTSGSNTHNIGGNVIVDVANMYLSGANNTASTSGSATWNISGNVTLTNGARLVCFESAGPHSGTATFNINGNLSMDATSVVQLRASGTINNTSCTGNLNVKGNIINNNSSGFTTSSGTSSGTAQFNLTFNGTSAQQWTGSFPTSNLSSNNAACNITMNNSAGLTLNNAVTLNGTLTLTNGKITTTSTNYINVAATGMVSGGSTSSFINGPLQHTIASASSTAKTFPLGKSIFYAPVVLTITQDAATSTNYKAEVFESGTQSRTIPGTIGGVSTSRYYNISKGTGAGVTNGQIQLVYDANDAGLTLSADNMRIVSDQGGVDWVDLGPAAGGTSPLTSGTNFTSFGNFAIANSPLGTTPDTKTVSGTAAICPGVSTNVTLASSQSGVTYDLFKNGVSQASTQVGDGNDLNWSVSAVGTYTIKTTTAGGYSATLMSGSAVITAKSAPSITGSSLAGNTYPQGGSANNLTVTVTGDGLIYQWYKSDDSSNATAGDDVTVGTNSNSYTPSTATQGTSYYYCTINGDCTPSATSSVSGAIVIVEACTAPTFSTQPTDNLNACINDTPISLGTVSADQSPTYQWYSNASKTNSGGSIIDGATSSSYSPSTSVAGTFYYYAVAINGACTTASNAVQFTVYPATAIQSQSTATATYGKNASATALTVTAVGKNIAYQWYSSTDAANNTASDDLTVGANSNSYTPPTATVGTLYYYCVVSGGCDPTSVTSAVSGAIVVVPYTTGDYKSVASANWGLSSTWQKWNGSAWAASADFPNATTAIVYIDGYTVNCETSGRSVKNLYLLNNGNLTSSSVVFSSPSYLKVYGSEVSVLSGSKIGTTVASSSGNSGDGISIDVFSTNLTFTGGGTIYLSRLRYNTASTTVVIDNDVHLNYHGSANAGNAAGLYSINVDNNVLTINEGKTLTFQPWTCFTPVSSSHTNSAYAWTFNINGTMNFIDGTVPGNATANGWTGHTNNYLSLGLTGKAFNLNIGSAGTLNVSELYPNGTKADNTIGTGDASTITIASGGVINVSQIADFRHATQSITGAGTVNLSGGGTIRIGNSSGINGAIQTTGSSLSTSANYQFEGTSAQVTGTNMPSTVNNLSIKNSTGVTLSKATAISGTLTVDAGTSLKNGGFTLTNNGTANINGTFQIEEGGWATGNNFVYGAAGTLVFNNSTGFYGVSGTPAYWPIESGPVNVTVQNTGGLELQVPRTVSGIFQTAAGVKNTFGNDLTVTGTVQLNSGGYFDNFSPTYSGTGSTLEYSTGGSYGSYNEWGSGSTVGYGVPHNLTLANATTVNLSGSKTINGNLTLTSGTLTTGANSLTLNGSISGAGTINSASGTLIFGGSSEQSLAAANLTSGSVNNLEIGAGSRLTTSGTITANGVTIRSSAAGIGTLTNSGTFSATTFNVEQYLSATRNYYITSPINNHTAPSTGITRFYEYIEPGDNVPAENSEPTGATAYWKGYTPASLTMTKGKGYIAQVNTPTTVTYSGSSINGNVSVPLTRTAGKTKTGFNLVGNPYTAYLDLSAVSTVNANIQPSLYVRTRSSSAYVFSTINVANAAVPVITSNNANTTVTKLVPPMQGFWVRLNEGLSSGNLELTPAMLAHRDQSGNTMKAPAAPMQLLRMQISNGTNIDESVIYFTDNASNGFDRFDSPKWSNSNAAIPEIFTSAGTEELVINGMNSYNFNTSIPLGLRTGENNNYTISATQVQNFDADTKIILQDNTSGLQTDLTAGENYSFTSEPVTQPSRFSVLFKSASGTTSVDNQNAKLRIYTQDKKILIDHYNVNNEDAKVKIFNGTGQLMLEQILTGHKTVINQRFNPGVYVVKISDGGEPASYKVIVK